MDNICNLKSTISSQLKRKTLFRGSFFAGIGAVLLVYSGTSLSVETLSTWGLLIFLSALWLIRMGSLPYRKLCKKEIFYDEICLETDNLNFLSRKYGIFSIPLKGIEKLSYRDTSTYGIEIFFQSTFIKILSEDKALQKYHIYSLKKHQCDWFLPHFSKNSYEVLESNLQDVMHS